MPAQRLSLIIISLVIIASNVRTAYSECYITGKISESKYSKLKDCLNLTEIDCGKDSSKFSTTDVLDISGEENGQEKLKLEYLDWETESAVAVLNISVRNIWCKKFTIRIWNDTNELLPTCHTVEFNGTRNLTTSLFTFVLERHRMTTEFFIEADGETKFRKYIFSPPDRVTLTRQENVVAEQIFNYLDMSDPDRVRLYIQPFDESFNVTKYNVTVKCANEIVDDFIFSINELYYDWKTSEGKNGSCFFIIKPIIEASKCSNLECSTNSIYFVLHKSDNRLLIMMVSLPITLFAFFIALRSTYRYCARRTWARRERPNCLLVYSSTHKEHIEVMIKLAEYLRACDINAMIDELDALEENLHNPYIWYHKAFEKATTVIITASPPYTGNWPSPYQFLDKLALKLMQSNLHLNNKDYITVKFPHCKRREDIPLEARSFSSFKLPKDLDKLVEKIQNIDYTKICKIPKDDFLISLNTAKEKICNQRWKTSVESSKSGTDGFILLSESFTLLFSHPGQLSYVNSLSLPCTSNNNPSVIKIGMEPFPVDLKSYTSRESINISDYSTDDDGAWLGIKKDEKEEVEIVEDEEDDDLVSW